MAASSIRARMLGNTGALPTVYGRGTGRMKKCFGCWDGCGYQPDKKTQRAREKRQLASWADEYQEPFAVSVNACPNLDPYCGCLTE